MERIVDISDLIPEESSALRGSVAHWVRKIVAGDLSEIPPITVSEIDGELLVRDGNNRVVAFRQKNITRITVSFKTATDAELREFRKVIEYRIAAGLKGFANMPLDDSEDDRARRYEKEEKDIRQKEFTNLLKTAAAEHRRQSP